ncbi:MAG TPA: TatD family hydrolase [Candidatus Paceibacterota bacterium]|nr:TatD family hydrolase [Candidatus Paceibacterota bacterium]
MEYLDTHSHLYMPQFDADRDAVIGRMRERGVSTIAVGVGLESSRLAVELAEEHPDAVLGATIGIHPTDTHEAFRRDSFEKLLSSGRVVGVGECGLDYFREPREAAFPEQQERFAEQIAFALDFDLPLMLHVRPSKGADDAHEDALRMLEDAARDASTRGSTLRGTAHFFTGSRTMAERYWALGFATSFPGVVTFAPELAQVVRAAPADLMLAETDAPFAAPIPHRGERNEPAFVADTVAGIAAIRGEDLQALQERLVANGQRIFGVSYGI